MSKEDGDLKKIKITKDNIVAATRLANTSRVLAQKNAITTELNGKIAECDARIKAASDCIAAEERTKEALLDRAKANVSDAVGQQEVRNRILAGSFGIENINEVVAIDIDMDSEEVDDETLGLLLIMEHSERTGAGRQRDNGNRSLDAPRAKHRAEHK